MSEMGLDDEDDAYELAKEQRKQAEWEELAFANTERLSRIESTGFTLKSIGAVAAIVDFGRDLAIFKDTWWAKGLAIFLLGYSLWKKGLIWASPILLAGMALLVTGYQDEKKKAESTTSGFDWEDAGGPAYYGPWRERRFEPRRERQLVAAEPWIERRLERHEPWRERRWR